MGRGVLKSTLAKERTRSRSPRQHISSSPCNSRTTSRWSECLDFEPSVSHGDVKHFKTITPFGVCVCVNTPRNTVNDFALMPRRPIHQKTSWRPRVVNYVELSNFAVSHLVELSLGWKYCSLWPPSLEFSVSHELPFLSIYAGGRSTMTTVRIQRWANDIYINIWKLLLKSAFIKTIPLSLLRSTSHVWF